MKIEHLVKRDYLTANPYHGLNSVTNQLNKNSAIVIKDKDKFLGVLSVNDISLNPKTLIIDCLISKPAIDSQDSVELAFSTMNKNNFDVLPVFDSGKFTGIIFRNDLANYINEYNLELEQKIKESTKHLEEVIAIKDRLYSVVAHDLRSPFTVIIGFTNLILEKIQSYSIDNIESQIIKVNHEAKSTLELLNNLLEWANSECGTTNYYPSICSVNNICNHVVQLFTTKAELKKIKFNIFHSSDNYVFADKNMFETTIRNLVSNAIKYSEEGGTIEIYSVENSDHIEINIANKGSIISNEEMGELFKSKKVKSKKGTSGEMGTGLGLLICQTFIEKNGGEIWAEKDNEKGTIFKFTLPLHK